MYLYNKYIRRHTAVERYPCLSTSCKPMVWHGYRPATVWQWRVCMYNTLLFNI